MWILFSQVIPPGIEQLFQLGFAATMAVLLLCYGLRFVKDVERNNRLNAITNLTNQVFFITFVMANHGEKHGDGTRHESCERLLVAFREAEKQIEKQRTELERELSKK